MFESTREDVADGIFHRRIIPSAPALAATTCFFGEFSSEGEKQTERTLPECPRSGGACKNNSGDVEVKCNITGDSSSLLSSSSSSSLRPLIEKEDVGMISSTFHKQIVRSFEELASIVPHGEKESE